GGTCADLTTTTNCGTCGNVCSNGQACFNSQRSEPRPRSAAAPSLAAGRALHSRPRVVRSREGGIDDQIGFRRSGQNRPWLGERRVPTRCDAGQRRRGGGRTWIIGGQSLG